jgi:hypothetical protein
MRAIKIITFILSASLCLLASGYRRGDSGHAIGFISRQGGKARHPSFLKSGGNRYTQIVTATVLPGYRGNARMVLEGSPPVPCEMHLAAPVVDLKLRRRPRLEKHTLFDLQPGDRIALWLVMHPAAGTSGGKYFLAFYDTASDRSLLRIPIIFTDTETTNEKPQTR